jgi:hypothetical protein
MSLTHFDAQGRAAMVDVSAKEETARVATARGLVVHVDLLLPQASAHADRRALAETMRNLVAQALQA